MKVLGVIPARWKSSRLEGKILANLLGKPLIQHVWEKAKASKLLNDLIIATDNEEVMNVVKGLAEKPSIRLKTSLRVQTGLPKLLTLLMWIL